VDFVFAGLPDATIIAVSIGNEVDGCLAADAQKWSQYARFVAAVSKHIKTTHPDIPIGVKTTWSALVKTQKSKIEALNRLADAIMVTYYPLNDEFAVRPPGVVGNELDQLVQIAGDKPVFLLETGYPSGSGNKSSEQQQAEFISAIFTAWDQHAESIQMVNFVWLYDMSSADVEMMTSYYGVANPGFKSFLATLGLKEFAGKDKQAFLTVKQHARARGWK
jgi:exo-beta-1,3-glucanase (GH17 family)